MELAALRTTFHEVLTSVFSREEIDAIFYRLTEAYCGYTRMHLALEPRLEVSEAEAVRLQAALEELKREKPVQYILNRADFYGLELYVDENVLIPRPETEELTDWVIRDIRSGIPSSGSPNIIDLGTGSGCMAVAIARHIPEAGVYALDISEAALNVARKNAGKYGAAITFIKADMLHLEDFSVTWDVIISNPPYVRNSEKAQMKNNVLQYEPHTALFVPGEDPLLYYKKIAEWASDNSKPAVQIYLEINPYLAEAIKEVLETNGFTGITLRKDLNGKDRMIRAIKNR